MKLAKRLKEMDLPGLEWELTRLEQEEEMIRAVVKEKEERYQVCCEVFQSAEKEFNRVSHSTMELKHMVIQLQTLNILIQTDIYEKDIEKLSNYQLTLKAPLEEKERAYNYAKNALYEAREKLRKVKDKKLDLRSTIKNVKVPLKEKPSVRSKVVPLEVKEVCPTCGRVPTVLGTCGCS
jgi:hypothetical protein